MIQRVIMDFNEEQRTTISDHFRQKAQARRAQEAAAPEVLALKITYEEPAPDGTFEILFMTREQADTYHKNHITSGRWATSLDVIEEVSFARGVELAKQPDCCGGYYALNDARRFQNINPVVQALQLDI